MACGLEVAVERCVTLAAQQARGKLEELIERGRARAAHVIAEVQRCQPVDRLVAARALRFSAPFGSGDDGGAIVATFGDHEERLHKNALHQAAERAELPSDRRAG